MGLIYNSPLVALSKQEMKQVLSCSYINWKPKCGKKIWGLIRYSKMLSSTIPKNTVASVIIGMIASVLEGTCQ